MTLRTLRTPLGARFALLLCMCAAGLPAVAAGAPKKKGGDDLEKRQTDYAKQLYGEGEKAMAAKDYDKALEKYEEAYRYAPKLHLFNYNIGLAAELGGNCQRARVAYQAFLDFVPSHANRSQAKKKVTELNKTCPYDTEDLEGVTVAGQEKRATKRKYRDAIIALRTALLEMRRSVKFYTAMRQAHPKTRAFLWAQLRKKRQEKRLVKLFDTHNVKLPDAGKEISIPVAKTSKDACAKAVTQEKRNARAFDKVLEYFETPEMVRCMNHFRRTAERRDRPAFTQCRK